MTKIEIHADLPPACIQDGATLDPRLPATTMDRAAEARCLRDLHIARSPAPRLPSRFRDIDGHRVSELFCERVHGRVTAVLPILEPGIAYDSEVLCGNTFVARLTPKQRQQVDACLADMAARGALPLAPTDDGSPNRYRLKDGPSDCVDPSTALALLDMSTNFEG